MTKYRIPSSKRNESFGTSGLRMSGGEAYQDPLKSMRGERAIRAYHEMQHNSSVIGAIRFLIRLWTTHAQWYVEPADQSAEARRWAEFVTECMHDMSHSWTDFLSNCLTMIDYGWSYHEIVYKLRKGENRKDDRQSSQYTDGKVGWSRIPLRHQVSWYKWDWEDDRLVGMVQNDTDNASGQVTIPTQKAIHFTTENVADNPDGRSLYRNAYVDWYFLKRIADYEAIGIERDMAGLPVMEVPIEMLVEDASSEYTALIEDIEKMLGQLKRDERGYAIVPASETAEGKTGWKFGLLSAPGRHQTDTIKVKAQYRANILQSVLAQFLEFGIAQHGSFALNSSATNNFATAIGGLMDNIGHSFTKQGINPLMRFNNVNQQYWPTLQHSDLETPSLEEIGNYVLSLSKAGLDMTGGEMRGKLLSFAKLPDDEE